MAEQLPIDEIRELVKEMRSLSKSIQDNKELEERITALEELIEGEAGMRAIISGIRNAVETLMKTREKGCFDCKTAQAVIQMNPEKLVDRVKVAEDLLKEHVFYWRIVTYWLSPAFVLSVIGLVWSVMKLVSLGVH